MYLSGNNEELTVASLSQERIREAVSILRWGGVVAFPTETVYGLGGDAKNPAAIKRIFDIKGRPADHPLIVHIAASHQLQDWACDIPPAAIRLAEKFWPGPLTLILKRHPSVPLCVTGGQETVGLRVPDHPVALALLQAFNGGLAAPSANMFGRISPTTAVHVKDELQGRVDMVLDGGSCRVGLESTIVSLVDDCPRLLRPGSILAQDIFAAIGIEPQPGTSETKIRVPGNLSSHYAPSVPLTLLSQDDLKALLLKLPENGSRVCALLYSSGLTMLAEAGDVDYELMPESAADYARRLYAVMRHFDRGVYASVLVETPPQTTEWSAINDRLSRASQRPVNL